MKKRVGFIFLPSHAFLLLYEQPLKEQCDIRRITYRFVAIWAFVSINIQANAQTAKPAHASRFVCLLMKTSHTGRLAYDHQNPEGPEDESDATCRVVLHNGTILPSYSSVKHLMNLLRVLWLSTTWTYPFRHRSDQGP